VDIEKEKSARYRMAEMAFLRSYEGCCELGMYLIMTQCQNLE
jgi:hypothetical protein